MKTMTISNRICIVKVRPLIPDDTTYTGIALGVKETSEIEPDEFYHDIHDWGYVN